LFGAGTLAVGSLWLAEGEIDKALRGEKTSAASAVDYYVDLVKKGATWWTRASAGCIKGYLLMREGTDKQALGWLGGFFSSIVAAGQGYSGDR